MNPFDRGLMALYALAGILAAAAAGLNLAGLGWPGEIMDKIAGVPGFYETALALLALYFLAGIRLLWQGLHPERRHAVVQENSLGRVRISLAAIESLVEKVAMDQRGIKEARAGVEAAAQGIGIRIKASVTPDINIPLLSAALQNTVRERVLEVTGIEVHDIRVSVESIAAQKLRVE